MDLSDDKVLERGSARDAESVIPDRCGILLIYAIVDAAELRICGFGEEGGGRGVGRREPLRRAQMLHDLPHYAYASVERRSFWP